MRFGNRLALASGLAVSILLGACSSTPLTEPAAASSASSAPAARSAATTAPTATAPVVAAYLDPQNPLYQKRSVYFDFDQFAIKPAYAPVIELHGKYLAAHPDVAIKIEGNTDEQGGREYNLALGQKRAEAVLKAFKVYGVKDSQVEAVSFGKEKPKASGHDEASYAENRRADLAYPAK